MHLTAFPLPCGVCITTEVLVWKQMKYRRFRLLVGCKLHQHMLQKLIYLVL